MTIHDYAFNILPGVGKLNNSLTGHSVLDRKRKKKGTVIHTEIF